MEKKYVLGILILLVAGAVFVAGVSMAEEVSTNTSDSGWRAQAIQAIENNSFEAWKAAMISGLTVERFNGIVQRHQARSESKAGMDSKREAVEKALEAGDYKAWKAAVDSFGKGRNISEMVSEEEFSTLVGIYKARESGDFETARSLMEESGLNMIPGIGVGFGMVGGRGHRLGRGHGCNMGLGLGIEE